MAPTAAEKRQQAAKVFAALSPEMKEKLKAMMREKLSKANGSTQIVLAKKAQEPKKKKEPKPKKEKQAKQPGAPAAHAMSPFNTQLIPALIPTGHAVAYRGSFTETLTQLTNQTIIMISTNYGDNAGVTYFLTKSVTAGVASVAGFISLIPAITANEYAGGPVHGRAMKTGITITSHTPILNRGGAVYYLSTPSKILTPALTPSAVTGAQFDAMFTAIVNTDGMVPYDTTHFGKTMSFSGSVADSNDYHNFVPWIGTATATDIWLRMSQDQMPMTYQIFAFSPPINTQVYTLSSRNTYYLRYPLGSMQAGLHREVPVATGPVVAALHRAGSALASGAHAVFDYALQEGGAFAGAAAGAFARQL